MNLNEFTKKNDIAIVAKLYNNEYLMNSLADTMELKDVYGIRSLFGLSSNHEIKFSDEWYQPMLELEAKADAMDEFKKIAFYNHLIFKKRYD